MEYDTAPASKASRAAWSQYMSQSLLNRLDTSTFDESVPALLSKSPLPPGPMADVWLRPASSNHESIDPRTTRYLQVLVRRKLVDVRSILSALYRYSTSHNYMPPADNNDSSKQQQQQQPLRWTRSYTAEETLFYRLSKMVQLEDGIKKTSEALQVCALMARWMVLFTAASAGFAQDVMDEMQNNTQNTLSTHKTQLREEMEAARAAFVMLLLNIVEHQVVLRGLSQPYAKDARHALSESLGSFIPSIMQSSSEIANRLELFRTNTLASFEPVDKKKKDAPDSTIDTIESLMALDSIVIPEIPMINSRAGLYIYLNAALVGRPVLYDECLFPFLGSRYQGDIQATTIDLILASFDVLANAHFRNEGQKTGHLLRSYLINKLPLLLVTLAGSMFPPLTAQACITEALRHVDKNAFPTLSSMFDNTTNNNTFTDTVRQDFCFACCLHGLIPEAHIEVLLGEITYQSLPQGGRYDKDRLVAGCRADSEKIQELIRELDNMDGNVGAVCLALIDVIQYLCANTDTMHLKALCSQLARKPLALDVMLLFGKPTAILQPLCEVLNNWRIDEDQGEHQPVYEEFGGILLLVLAFVFRYDLSAADLGVQSPDSFIARFLHHGHLSRSSEELTEPETRYLDGWINGLFDTEAGGLGDELMSSCAPQDFYLLVPTLFHNIALAYDSGNLDDEDMKTGLEYLVDTFLLPSLVMAITYMSNQIWSEGKTSVDGKSEQKAVIRILQLILFTKQGSDEAQNMLSAVINIVAKPLEHSLRLYQRQDPKCQAVEPLLNAIKENIRFSRRTAGAGHNELEAWTSSANGGLAASVRHTIQGLVQWSVHPAVNTMPASYTHRQILAAHRILGAKHLVQVILEELRQQTDTGSGSIAYDVATTLICAPDPTNAPPIVHIDPNSAHTDPEYRITLHEALKSEAQDFKSTFKHDPALAYHVVRLYRQVEARIVRPQPAAAAIPQAVFDLDENAAAAIIAAQGDGLVTSDGGLNLNLNNAADDMGLAGSVGISGGLDFGADDDVFGDLGAPDGANDLLDGWDSMDMS
ncbi:mediator complex subunit Med5 [Xylariaceae sp. FL1019]|nr:mediator complex subunit Med5 [Xylariaceae sp. FL1019]